MLIKLEDNSTIHELNGKLDLGCIVDTNVVFAATFPLDTHNEWADQVFNKLQSSRIPIFTNINIRSEFIELNRRVLIPECLVDFYEAMRGCLNPEIEHKLKSLKSLKARATLQGRAFKLSDSEIKKFRQLLSAIKVNEDTNAWTLFCRDYFHKYITTVWETAINELGIQFLGTRAIENEKYFNAAPKWTDMLDIIGNSGIGSSDAMIINLFLKSKLPLIITADSDVRDTVISMMPKNKFVLAP